MKEPSDRLRELRMKKGYNTAADAARAFGWNDNTYKSHENGERGIKLAVARKYAAAFGSTASYILTGDEGQYQSPQVTEINNVPLAGVVAAGLFRDHDFEQDDDTAVPAVIRRGIPKNRQYAVRVDGPSVNRRIPDGMYAICVPLDSFPGGARMGSLVHVIREQDGSFEHTIKEVRLGATGLMLFPVSDDPRFQEPVQMVESEHMRVRINGVVIGAYQPF